jgi:4'-phosphopantetheinyl transferase
MEVSMPFEPQTPENPLWTPCSPAEMNPGLLERGEIHLHLLPLAQADRTVETLASTLTPDEHERAARFHFDRDRRRFIVARGLLRRLLGHYAGAPAEAIRFAYGPFGKPHLVVDAGQPKLEFSLSHSEDWALAGFARGREIGVDLEAIRPISDYRDLADTNFAPAETAALLALPEDQQIEGFFACWTRKEAYVKALGLGLSLDLSSFVVTVRPDGGAETIPASPTASAHRVWGMRALPGFWAAAAVDAPNQPVEPLKTRLAAHSMLAT